MMVAGQDFNIKNLFKKAVVKQKSSASKGPDEEALFTMALALSAAVKKIFYEKSEMKFSAEPVIEKKLIIHFVDRMRVDGMEKFNNPTVFSAIHFFEHPPEKRKKEEPLGVLIVYVEKKFLPELLRLLKYPYIDYDEEDEVKDGCGAICNLIAGQWKKELMNLGYIDLEMSYFRSYINTIVNGIEFPKDQTHRYEISFDIDKKKGLVVEMVMGKIPLMEIQN